MNFKLIAVFFILIPLIKPCVSQNSNVILPQNPTIEYLNSLYTIALENDEKYLLGEDYQPKGNQYNHPYFGSYKWEKVTIWSKGKEYSEKLALYDIELDVLIILKTYNKKSFPIKLELEAIDKFSINKNLFIKIDQLGFLEETFINDSVRVYTKHIKKGKYGTSNYIEFNKLEKVYLSMNNNLTRIKSINQLLKLFADKKQDLKIFKNENALNFASNRTHATHKMVVKYIELTTK